MFSAYWCSKKMSMDKLSIHQHPHPLDGAGAEVGTPSHCIPQLDGGKPMRSGRMDLFLFFRLQVVKPKVTDTTQ